MSDDLGIMMPLMYPQISRGIEQFAEEEVILPRGPMRSMAFDANFMPFCKFIFDAIDDDYYKAVALVACTQSGKSLMGTNIPILYYLFEKQEDCLYGVPMMSLAHGVWTEKIFPVINDTKYKKFMPQSGKGSRGGNFDSVLFGNGSFLRFLAAGGNAAQQSSHTAKYLLLTEIDKFDEATGDGREADPVSLMLNRLDAFEDSKAILECTVTTEHGRIWHLEFSN